LSASNKKMTKEVAIYSIVLGGVSLERSKKIVEIVRIEDLNPALKWLRLQYNMLDVIGKKLKPRERIHLLNTMAKEWQEQDDLSSMLETIRIYGFKPPEGVDDKEVMRSYAKLAVLMSESLPKELQN